MNRSDGTFGRSTRFALLVATISALTLGAGPAPVPSALDAPPVFVGKSYGEVPAMSPVKEMALGYMTAPEMQAKVARLTGYVHPAFIAYGDVLGRLDPRTGLRTNDRPSLITIFFMQKIADSVAASIVRRELFLDDDERIVFQGVDLEASPSDAQLASLGEELHTRWLGTSAGAEAIRALTAAFRQAETAGSPAVGYGALIGLMIRHGGLYYY